jgi:hypothetical protein
MDLLEEIVATRGEPLSEKLHIRLKERFMNLEHIRRAFQDELEVSLFVESTDEARMNFLLATRNSIEHADCRATKEYLRLVESPLSVGDTIPAGSKEVGDALSLV